MKTEPVATKPTMPAKVSKPSLIAIKKILVPTDFSGASHKALEYAAHFAKSLRAELIFVHVLESPSNLPFESLPTACAEELKANCEENLAATVRAARTAGVSEARPIVRTGAATHEILEAAKELEVDLIVIGTHGLAGWEHFTIGSTAERVARAAFCPVLIVREKQHDFI